MMKKESRYANKSTAIWNDLCMLADLKACGRGGRSSSENQDGRSRVADPENF
jgi:hypothetical protein